MSSSLDSLTKSLVRGGKKLFGFDNYSELQYDLLTRKGVYPYEYVNFWNRFNETQLPPIDVFYSNLNMSSIRKIINTLSEFGKNLESTTWEIITIFISEQMWSCWQTCIRLLEIPA